MLSLDSKRSSRSELLGWKVASTLSGVAGAVVARNLIQSVWAALSRSEKEPPLNPADREIDWPTALQWAIAAGIGAGIARLVSQRAAAAAWERATGSPPPGIDT